MTKMGRYDAELQMFVEETKDFDVLHLEFLQYLIEKDRLNIRVEDTDDDQS